MTSFWEKQKALAKQLDRAIHLARTNIDYQVAHPNECRDNPDHKILAKCHPEAEKRITKKVLKIQHLSIRPHPKFVQSRFNRT